MRPSHPGGGSKLTLAARKVRRADLVHGLHMEIPTYFGGPTVATVHDLIPLTHPESMPQVTRRLIYRRMIRTTLRKADHLIVPSPQTADEVRQAGGSVPISIVPIGLDATFTAPLGGEHERNDRSVVVVTGAKAHKNAAILGEIIPLVRKDIDASFSLVGWPFPDVPTGARSLGHVPDAELAKLYRASTVLLLPSTTEGFGLPVVEAAAAGTPVVCGWRIGARAWIQEGSVAVDVRDPTAVAEQLLRILSNTELAQSIGRKAAEEAGPLTVERMALDTATVYEALLGTNG